MRLALKRSGFAFLALSFAAGTGASLAAGPGEFNARCGDVACRVERVPAAWQLVAVDGELQLLKVVYRSGGCRRGNPRATVRGNAARIRITIDQEEVVALDTSEGTPVCTKELRYRNLNVLLKRPVGGRRIVGGPRLSDEELLFPVNGVVPRVIDLAAADARAVLDFLDFPVRVVGGRAGPVAFQSPLPGRRIRGRAVRLTVGRRNFDARSLSRCVEEAGLAVATRRPGVGDADAPDLELLLQPGDPSAFVALYADPVRAEELAPADPKERAAPRRHRRAPRPRDDRLGPTPGPGAPRGSAEVLARTLSRNTGDAGGDLTAPEAHI